MKKRSLFLILCCVIALCLTAFAAPTSANVDIKSKNAVMIDAKTGQILYGKNPYTLASSGDFNKLLTIITALEEFEELPDEITVNGSAIIYNPTPPYLGLKEGQTVKFMDMLYAMYLGGYNDAANVVADTLGRQLLDTDSADFREMTAIEQTNAAEDAFAKLMNRKADELLCPTMKATNPDGHFYDTQQCSPNDVAQLVRSCIKNDTFRKLFMTPVYTITGNPTAVNNQHADTEDKYDNAKEKLGEDAKADELPEKPRTNYPYVTDTEYLSTTNQTFEIKTTNKLFSGEILYNGITGGINAYNRNNESYHSMVYAKNGDRSLIVVVMNSSETGFYDDIQALLNFGFYQWNEASLSDRELNKMLPDNIASKDLAFSGRTSFWLPSSYTTDDLEYAVAYTENGYLSGTITLTLPDAAYAGTIATVSFYEKNEKSVMKPFLIAGGVILGIILVVVIILFLRRMFSPQRVKNKSRALFHRTRKTAKQQKMKQMQANGGGQREPSVTFEKGRLYSDPYAEPPKEQKKTRSDNRQKADEVRRKKEAKKRHNRRNRNTK